MNRDRALALIDTMINANIEWFKEMGLRNHTIELYELKEYVERKLE